MLAWGLMERERAMGPARRKLYSQARVATRQADALVFDAGFKAAMSAVTLVAGLAAGAYYFENRALPAQMASGEAAASYATLFSTGPVQSVAPAALAAPPSRDPDISKTSAETAPALEAAAILAITQPARDAWTTPVPLMTYDFTDGALLQLRLSGDRVGPTEPFGAFSPRFSGEPGALSAFAQRLVTEWEQPSTRDVRFFLASDNESLSWSLSQGSPNHGALAYQGDAIEMGDLSAGVSMSVHDLQVALAYVERRTSTDLIGVGSEDESFAGLVLTRKN